MAENVKEKNSSKTVIIILIIVIVLLLAGGGVAAMILLNKSSDDSVAEPDFDTNSNGLIHYDAAAVPVNEADYAERIKELYEKAEEGYLTLQYKNEAYSEDGVHFICEIGNSAANHYDMYFNIYLDENFEEQILLTGLFPPGSGIEEFDSEIPLDPGEYRAVLALTQIEDDHSTFHAQSFVTIYLKVGEFE